MPDLMRTRRGIPAWLDTASGWSWRGLLVALGILALVWVLAQLYLVVFPVIVALLLSTLLEPLARWLRQRGFPPAAAAFTVIPLRRT